MLTQLQPLELLVPSGHVLNKQNGDSQWEELLVFLRKLEARNAAMRGRRSGANTILQGCGLKTWARGEGGGGWVLGVWGPGGLGDWGSGGLGVWGTGGLGVWGTGGLEGDGCGLALVVAMVSRGELITELTWKCRPFVWSCLKESVLKKRQETEAGQSWGRVQGHLAMSPARGHWLWIPLSTPRPGVVRHLPYRERGWGGPSIHSLTHSFIPQPVVLSLWLHIRIPWESF